MAAVLIPIDPDKKDDIYYRYKMPAVQVKVEGSGNGIKTVIPNIHEICSALNRPEEVLMKFFQFELGAQSTILLKDDKYLVMGKHTDERMQELIYSFIRKFILCSSCSNPETTINLNVKRKAEQVTMTCSACGKLSHMDIAHRAYSIMCQHYVKYPEEAKSGKGAAESRNKDAKGEAAGTDSPAPVKATAGTDSPAPVQATAAAAAAAPAATGKKEKKDKTAQSDIKDDRANPMEVFASHMRDAEAESAASSEAAMAKANGGLYISPAAMENLTTQLVRMAAEYNLEEQLIVRLAIYGVFHVHAKEPMAAVKAFAPLLRRFSTPAELYFRQETFDEKMLSSLLKREDKIQKAFILDAAYTIANEKASAVPAAERMPVLLFLLFIEGVLKDTSILNYATEKKTTSGIDAAVDVEMKKNSMAVVEWLQVQKPESSKPKEEAATA